MSMLLFFKKLQKQLEFLQVQEDYIKDEQKNLKKEYLHAQEEVKRIQSVPLVIGQFLEAVDQNNGIVGSTTGLNLNILVAYKERSCHLLALIEVEEPHISCNIKPLPELDGVFAFSLQICKVINLICCLL
jgi:ATP-dependent 26S proteasome regulatory subunit